MNINTTILDKMLAFPRYGLKFLLNYKAITYLRMISSNVCTFVGEKDRFNGVTVDTNTERCSNDMFQNQLEESLQKWSSEGRRCVWFKVHINESMHVPILAKKGFNFHHARDNFVMMYKWLPTDTEANLPPPCHTNLGVGALVINKSKKILAVSEKHYDYPHLKLPGGYVERGEDIKQAAVREVKEETGIDSEFQSIITFRHTHNMMYGNSDIYVLLMMKALSEKITISQREVKDCRWIDVKEYTNHPHVHAFNKLIVKEAFRYRDKKIRLNLEKKTVKWSQITREMNFLTVTDYNYE